MSGRPTDSNMFSPPLSHQSPPADSMDESFVSPETQITHVSKSAKKRKQQSDSNIDDLIAEWLWFKKEQRKSST